ITIGGQAIYYALAETRTTSPLLLLQPALCGHGPDRARLAVGEPRVRPRARTHARKRPLARGSRLPGLESGAPRMVHLRRRGHLRRLDPGQPRPLAHLRPAATP